MESLKDLLTPKTFNKISYVAVICWILYGVTLLSIFAAMENSDSFRCGAKLQNKDVVQGKCSDQYKKQYNKSGIPVYGFVIANFSLIGIACVIYSQVVKSKVDEVEANRRSAGAESQNNDDNRPKRRLFVAYFCQLATRFAIGIIFIVLQTQVLYPDNFPTNFHCQIEAASDAASASSTSNIQNSTMYECHNQQATKITSWMNAVIVGNAVLALIILIEIICILVLRVKKGKKFLRDLEFVKSYLPSQEPQELGRPCPEEPIGLLPITPPEEEQLEEPPSVDEFIKRQREIIKESTEKDPGLKALFQEKHGEGKRNKDLKLDRIYTNLSLIKDRAQYKTTGNRQEQLKMFPMPQEKFQQITREEIVDAENNKILIVGRPGIGKTLFLTKWIRDWASDKAFNGDLHFDFAFFLKFRKFNSDEKPLSLRDLLLRSEYPLTLSDEVWNQVVRNPERVLILFDGLDEFLRRSKIADERSACRNGKKPMPLSALVYNLVEGNLLPGASVLTTTRPSAVEEVTDLPFDKTIEILGFTSEQVEEYVKNFARDAAKDLQYAGKKIWEHIKTNMNIFSLFRHGEHRDEPLRREDINSKHLPPEVEKKIKPLAKLAFDGLAQKRLIFGEKEVPEDLLDSALFYRLRDLKTTETSEAQYCFIHLTMQEFLAAKHITETMKGRKLKRFVKHYINEVDWQLVLQFVAGLLGDRDEQSVEIFTKLLPKKTEEKDESRELMLEASLEGPTVTCWPTDSEKYLALTLLKCIQETNESGSVVQSKLEEIGFNAVDFSECRLAPADCTAVVHFIKRVQQISLINLYYNNIGSLGCVEIVKLFDKTNCQLRGLNLAHNNIGVEGVKQLSNALVNSQLSRLNLKGNNIGYEGVKQLSNALVNSQLSSLDLRGNNITDQGARQLSNALVNNNKLRRLYLGWNDKITHEAMGQIIQAIPNCKVTIEEVV